MKAWNYAFLAIGLSILFEYAGLITSGGVLGLIGFSRVGGALVYNFSAGGLFRAVFTSTGILIGITTGLVVGFITKSNPENYIILPFITGTLGLFIQAFIGVVSYSIANVSGWITALVILILGPMIPLFIIALVEFFRGTD